jgi:hypothetical protein
MFEGVKIHIGGQTRTLRLRQSDVIAFQALIPWNATLLQALARNRDVAAIATATACALRHESEGKGKDKKISPSVVCAWLDREPGKYRELEDAVLTVAEAHYVAQGVLDVGDLTGEVPPATTTPPSPAGSPSSASPAGGSSSPSSSDG